jgi:glycosyltransferase involved in cell wall biosynthesis
MRVAIVTLGDSDSVATWSGTPHFATNQIKKHFPDAEVIYTKRLDKLFMNVGRVGRKLGWDCLREPLVARLYGASVDSALEKVSPDVLISIGATYKLAYMKWSGRVVHVSDALFDTIVKTHDNYAKSGRRTLKLGNSLQQRMLDKADLLLLTSHWAREGALSAYELDPERVKVVPLGANVEDPGDQVLDRGPDRLKILFVGNNWEKKGGPRLLDVFGAVRRRLPDAELHIVGCNPFSSDPPRGLFVHGFLDKRNEVERNRLRDLYQGSSLLCVLSLHEAYGLVYCEAAAHGLPAMANDTGGVSTIIADKVTGRVFRRDDSAEAIAEEICELWQDGSRYSTMRKAARERFRESLSWTAWGMALRQELEQLNGSTTRLE